MPKYTDLYPDQETMKGVELTEYYKDWDLVHTRIWVHYLLWMQSQEVDLRTTFREIIADYLEMHLPTKYGRRTCRTRLSSLFSCEEIVREIIESEFMRPYYDSLVDRFEKYAQHSNQQFKDYHNSLFFDDFERIVANLNIDNSETAQLLNHIY